MDVRLVDAPSAPPIILRWKSPLDGKRSLSGLILEVENTTGDPIDVDLHVVAGGKGRAARVARALRVGGRTSVDREIPVTALPVQLVGASADLFANATYVGVDGLQRTTPTTTLWVEHSPGFATARIRERQEEALANAGLGLASVARRASAARVLDAVGRAIPADLAALPMTGIAAQSADLPDPEQYRIPSPISEASKPSDTESPEDLPATHDALVDKGGNYKICFKLGYNYIDAKYGEDYLIGQTPSSVGHEPARYMLATLRNAANGAIWSGRLDSLGCSPYLNHANGSYSGWVTTAIYRPASDVYINVTASDSSAYIWYWQNYSISGTGGTITLDAFGADTVSSTAVAAANTLYRSVASWPGGTTTNIYVNQNCPNMGPGVACASASSIWLGPDKQGIYLGWFKFVTAHELGHRVMGAMFGLPSSPYTIDTTQPLCRCDHVTNASNLHCLQSRHQISTAQVEGWAQFYASKNVNNGADSNCVFVYYKQFYDGTSVQPVPNVKSCYSPYRWMETKCNGTKRGVEMDWMGFYWRLANKDSYAFGNFTSLYTQACGGSCSGKSTQVEWLNMVAAANATFGAGTAKASAWAIQGDAYGVNH